jgi:hypothetical protein
LIRNTTFSFTSGPSPTCHDRIIARLRQNNTLRVLTERAVPICDPGLAIANEFRTFLPADHEASQQPT